MTNWFIWFKFDLRKIFNEKLFYLLTVCLFVVFRLSECHDWGPTRERDRRLDLERFLLFRLESQSGQSHETNRKKHKTYGKCTSLVQVVHKFSLTHLTIFLYDDTLPRMQACHLPALIPHEPATKLYPQTHPHSSVDGTCLEKDTTQDSPQVRQQERAGDRDEEE